MAAVATAAAARVTAVAAMAGMAEAAEAASKYSRGPQSSQSVPRLHCAPIASTCPSWQKLLLMNCWPPLSKGLRQVLSQSFGGCGEDGGEDAALVVVTNASSIAMSPPKG